jgi:hypothetical protein
MQAAKAHLLEKAQGSSKRTFVLSGKSHEDIRADVYILSEDATDSFDDPGEVLR